MPGTVTILPHFVLKKIAPICNNNESYSANRFQREFIGISIFQIPPVKIYRLGYTLVNDFFLEKHLYMIFQKYWVGDTRHRYRLA